MYASASALYLLPSDPHVWCHGKLFWRALLDINRWRCLITYYWSLCTLKHEWQDKSKVSLQMPVRPSRLLKMKSQARTICWYASEGSLFWFENITVTECYKMKCPIGLAATRSVHSSHSWITWFTQWIVSCECLVQRHGPRMIKDAI